MLGCRAAVRYPVSEDCSRQPWEDSKAGWEGEEYVDNSTDWTKPEPHQPVEGCKFCIFWQSWDTLN